MIKTLLFLQQSHVFSLSLFSYKRFHAVCDLCADKEHEHHQGKIVKAGGRYVPTCSLMMHLSSHLKMNGLYFGFIAPD